MGYLYNRHQLYFNDYNDYCISYIMCCRREINVSLYFINMF